MARKKNNFWDYRDDARAYFRIAVALLHRTRKVDGKSLPEAVDCVSTSSAPLTSLERVVAGVWEDTLGKNGDKRVTPASPNSIKWRV